MFLKKDVIFRNCVFKDGKVIFFQSSIAIPMAIDVQNGEGIVLPFEYNEKFRERRFDLVVEADGNIYLLDMAGKFICRYQPDTGKQSFIEIDCNYKNDGNFIHMDVVNNNIYIFPIVCGIVVYNYNTNAVKRVSYPVQVDEIAVACKVNNKFLLIDKQGMAILYNTENNEWEDVTIPAELNNPMHVCYDNNYIYILCGNGSIVQWDMKEYINIINEPVRYYNEGLMASRLCLASDKYIIMPLLAEDILIVDRYTHEVTKYDQYPDDFYYTQKTWAKYRGYCETEDTYFFACRVSKYIVCISKKNGDIKWIKSQVNYDDYINYQMDKYDGIITEKENYLQNYIDDICRRKHSDIILSMTDKS